MNQSDDYVIQTYTEEHAGIYQCQVRVHGHSDTSRPLEVTTNPAKPRVTGAPRYVNNGTLVILRCQTNNPEHRLFRWYKNDQLILDTNSSSRKIKFKPFQYSDDGVYKCLASDVAKQFVDSSNQVNMTTVDTFALCKCPCPPGIKNITLTDSELAEKVDEIVKNLTVETSSLSAHKRRKQSAVDKRKVIEIAKKITISVYCVIFGPILFLDVVSALIYLLCKCKRRRRRRFRRESRSARKDSLSAMIPLQSLEIEDCDVDLSEHSYEGEVSSSVSLELSEFSFQEEHNNEADHVHKQTSSYTEKQELNEQTSSNIAEQELNE